MYFDNKVIQDTIDELRKESSKIAGVHRFSIAEMLESLLQERNSKLEKLQKIAVLDLGAFKVSKVKDAAELAREIIEWNNNWINRDWAWCHIHAQHGSKCHCLGASKYENRNLSS